MPIRILNKTLCFVNVNKNGSPPTPSGGSSTAPKVNQLTPFFQPIIGCSGGHLSLIGFEVLARFENFTKKTCFFPSDLINEQTSLAVFDEVTEFLLKKTLETISTNAHQVSEGCFVNVNISPRQLGSRKTFEIISRYSAEFLPYGFRLNVEITEGGEVVDYDTANKFIVDLSSFGVNFYIDDYGKGFSSPALLKNLVVYGIKIDKEFVHDIEKCSFSREFISHTVSQASNKGVKVIAEGVETITQHRLLSDLGVDFTQGYLYGKPHPTISFNEIGSVVNGMIALPQNGIRG